MKFIVDVQRSPENHDRYNINDVVFCAMVRYLQEKSGTCPINIISLIVYANFMKKKKNNNNKTENTHYFVTLAQACDKCDCYVLPS